MHAQRDEVLLRHGVAGLVILYWKARCKGCEKVA